MVSIRKKLIVISLIASLFTASTFAPKRAEAAAGLLVIGFGGSALVGSGFFLASVGGGTASLQFFQKGWNSKGLRAVASYLLAAVIAVGAFYLLDESQAESGEFESIDAGRAAAIGMDALEHAAYEAELPLINSLREEVLVRTNLEFKDLKASSPADLQKVSAFIRSTWQELSGQVLSAESVSAIEKMGQTVVGMN